MRLFFPCWLIDSQGTVSFGLSTGHLRFFVFKEPLSRPRFMGSIAIHDWRRLPCWLFYVVTQQTVMVVG